MILRKTGLGKTLKDNIKTSAKEGLGLTDWKQPKPRFDEECLGCLYQRKQAKIQWLQDPKQSNVSNSNNVRHEASRQCKKKKMEYLKAIVDELGKLRVQYKYQRLV
jgi:hypothetical protein